MKKALFVIFHGFDPNNGISKKIFYQVNALKASMDLILTTESARRYSIR